MQGKALVFSGGGAKGAYEAGVWKALRELHLDTQIRLVSGTSAGALNAALFTQGNLEEALDVWTSVSNREILIPNALCQDCSQELCAEDKQQLFSLLLKEGSFPYVHIPFLDKAGVWLYKHFLTKFIVQMEDHLNDQLAKALVPCFLNILMELKTTQDFSAAFHKTVYFMEQLLNEGLFSQEGLRRILDTHLHEREILNADISLYVTAYNTTKKKIKHFHFNAFNVKEYKDMLLASSAIPFVFDPVIIGGDTYVDGGIPLVGDNTPIDVAYRKGYREIIVVVLNAKEQNLDAYEDANILLIQPEESLGSSLASLDFDKEYTGTLIIKGYEDAMKTLRSSAVS